MFGAAHFGCHTETEKCLQYKKPLKWVSETDQVKKQITYFARNFYTLFTLEAIYMFD